MIDNNNNINTINPIHNINDNDGDINDKVYITIPLNDTPAPDKKETKPRNSLKDVKDQDKVEFYIIVMGAAFLSFNSGFINSVCIQAHSQGVTHVTGTLTYSGIYVANNDAFMLLNTLCIICCYMFGAAITGYFTTEVTPLKLGLEYGPLFIIGSSLLFIACLFEYSFPDNHSAKSYLYLFFCSMASGLQNGITTKYSNNVLRTTHMTGTATDIGIVLGRICAAKYDEFWRILMLLPSYLAFFCGGIFGVGIFKRMGRYSLTLSIIIFFTIGVCYIFGVRAYIMKEKMNRELMERALSVGMSDNVKETVRKFKRSLSSENLARTLSRSVSSDNLAKTFSRSVSSDNLAKTLEDTTTKSS